MKKLSFSPDFFILIGAFCLCEGILPVGCMLFCMLIHEAGHGALLLFFRAGVESLRFTAAGGTMKPREPLRLSPKREAAVYLSGPFLNLLAGFLFAFFGNRFSFCYLLSGMNFSLGLFNLLPVGGFDGGQLLLCLSRESRRMQRVLFCTSVLIGFAGIIGGLLLCTRGFAGASLVIFGLWVCFVKNPLYCCEKQQVRV